MSRGRRLLVSASPGELRIQLRDGAALAEYAIWRPGLPDGVDDLHRGRVVSVVPALGGAFVALAGGAEGFLTDSAGAAGRGVGDLLVVRVVRAGIGGKGPRLAAQPDAAADGPSGMALLARGPGPLLELAGRHPDAPVLIDDAAWVPVLRPALGERLTLVARAWAEAEAADAEALAEPSMVLPGGMIAHIHPTPALVAIDIDSAGASAARASKASAQMAANLAALPALAAAIRLRALSGAILIDFAGLAVRKRAALAPALASALAADPAQPRLLGFTRLGLAEIVRPRRRAPLHEMLAGPHAAGLAALRAIDRMVAADPARMPVLRAAPAVVSALEADTAALPTLAARTGRALRLRSDPGLAAEQWVIEAAR